MTRRGRWPEAVRGLAVFVGAASLVAGAPLVIARVGRWPLPTRWPDWAGLWARMSGGGIPADMETFAIKTISLVAWWCWLSFTVALTVEVAARTRGRVAPTLAFTGGLQPIAAKMAAVLVLSLGPHRSSPTGPVTRAAVVTSAAPVSATPSRPEHDVIVPLHASPPPPAVPSLVDEDRGYTYRVRAGETASEIAGRALGDSRRWRELVALNPSALADPMRPAVGAEVRLPTVKWVLTRPGDNLSLLAERHLGDERRASDLADLNRWLVQPDRCCVEGRGDFIRPHWLILLPPDAHDASTGQIPAAYGDLRAGAASIRQSSPVEVPATPPPAPPAPSASPPPSVPVLPPRPANLHTPTGAVEHGTARTVVRRTVVRLPNGGAVGLSFATGAMTTLALARLKRRRAWRPVAPAPGLGREQVHPAARFAADYNDQGDLASMPTPDARTAHGTSECAVEVGEIGGAPAHLDLTVAGGVAVSGEEALEFGRSVVLTALLCAHEWSVMTDAATAVSLFGQSPLPATVNAVPTDNDVLSAAEVEFAHRARVLEREGAEAFSGRTGDDEPMGPLLIVLQTVPLDSGRFFAIASEGARLGAGLLVLDTWRDAAVDVSVSDGGSLSGYAPLNGAFAYRLLLADALPFLDALAEAHREGASIDRPSNPETVPSIDDLGIPEPPNDLAPVSVTLFGGLEVSVNGVPIRSGVRERGREALALMVLRPKGMTLGGAVAKMWPDANSEQAQDWWKKAVGSLRKTLREASGRDDLDVIESVGSARYRPEVGALDVDVWRFERALDDAARLTDEGAVVKALNRALEEYAGDLLDGALYEWVEPIRADIRSRALDAVSRLADVHEGAERLEDALTALRRGIAIEPLAEHLYARAIDLLCRLDRIDAAKELYRQLEQVLAAEIGEEPLPESGGPIGRYLDRRARQDEARRRPATA